MFRLQIILLTLATCFAAACQGTPTPSAKNYETMTADTGRDSELARKENEKAIELIQKNEAGQAEETLKRALAADVTFGPAHNNLGKVYFAQAKLYLAAWEFQYAIKLMPNQPEPKNNLGMVYEAAGKLDSAVDCYQKAMAQEPEASLYAGNLLRARIRRGDDRRQLRSVCEKLIERETRPDWLEWEKIQLAQIPPSDAHSEHSPN